MAISQHVVGMGGLGQGGGQFWPATFSWCDPQSRCHLGNGGFKSLRDYSKCSASVQEKDKAAFKGRQEMGTWNSICAKATNKSRCVRHTPCLLPDFLWSKLSNLAQSQCAICKQLLARGKGRHPRQVGAGGGWGGQDGGSGLKMLTAGPAIGLCLKRMWFL